MVRRIDAVMWSPPASREDRPDARAVRWLRLVKLVLTVVLLAVAVWNTFAGAV